MITCMKFISLEGQQSEKVVSRCLTSSASSWICTRFQVLRKTWNWLTRDKLSWNRFSPPFFSNSKKIDEFRHAKQVLLVNPISSLVVKWRCGGIWHSIVKLRVNVVVGSRLSYWSNGSPVHPSLLFMLSDHQLLMWTAQIPWLIYQWGHLV